MNYTELEDVFIICCFIALFILYLLLMVTIARFNKRIRIIDQAFANDPKIIQAMIDLEEFE